MIDSTLPYYLLHLFIMYLIRVESFEKDDFDDYTYHILLLKVRTRFARPAGQN